FTNSTKSDVRAILDSVFRGRLGSRSMSNMSNVAVVAPNPASYQSTYWLALALTQGLGPTRIKKLIEHYGTAERVFQASLTELEATGRRGGSAQTPGSGKDREETRLKFHY